MNWVEYLSDVKLRTQLDITNVAAITKKCFILFSLWWKKIALAIKEKHLRKTWSGQSVWIISGLTRNYIYIIILSYWRITEALSCMVHHLSPGAVLPALQQTVTVTSLTCLWFGQVYAGSGLHALAQSLVLAVAHAQHVQRTVTRTAFTGAVAPARHVPPEEERRHYNTESVTCHCSAHLVSAKCFSVVFTFLAEKPRTFNSIFCKRMLMTEIFAYLHPFASECCQTINRD